MASQNIFAALAQPVRSVADYQADYDSQDLRKLQLVGAQRQNALAELTQRQQIETTQQNALERAARLQAAQQAAGDEAAYAKALRLSGYPGNIDAADKVDKAISERGEVKSKNAGRDVETENKVVTMWRDMIGNATTPEQAAQMVTAMHSDPRIANTPIARVPLEQGLAILQQTPFDVWKQKFALGAAKFVELNKPTYQQQNLGGTMQTLALPGLGGAPSVVNSAPITQSADNAATQETARRGQNLTDARSRETNQLTREANATVYDPERGMLINKATSLARPAATLDGKPLGAKDKPLPEGAQKQLIGTRNLQDAVANYREKLQGWSNGKMLSPDARAEMGNAYNNMMLQAKEAYNLGVLNGPDYDILQSVVKDPTKPASVLTSNGALDKQATELARIAAGIERTALESHGKPYTPRPEPQPAGKPGGVATIASDAEYNALPSGATFVGPDGKTRRKP